MKLPLLFLLLCIACSQTASSQTAADVLEKGIRIREKEKLFFQLDQGILRYQAAISRADLTAIPNFNPLKDSAIFLSPGTDNYLYALPVNPLNFSFTTESKEVTDPVNEATATAMSSIITSLGEMKAKLNEKAGFTEEACDRYKRIEANLKLINESLQHDQKSLIIKAFNDLKLLTFEEEANTKTEIDKIEKNINPIITHFSDLDSLLKTTRNDIQDYQCDTPAYLFIKFIYNTIFKDLAATADEQKKRAANLGLAFNLVKKAQAEASIGGGLGLRWCIKLPYASFKDGKELIYTITTNKTGYALNAENEIVPMDSNALVKRIFIIRRYRPFVPEVSVGTAYTFFTYPTYGTSTDSEGKQYIASPTENPVSNLNISTMVNFNLYIPNSNLHPLYQLGLGLHSGAPVLLTGIGLRSNIDGMKRFAISTGFAMTWIKDLDKLKVGDQITGTSDIDKDLKYQFSWPPKPYVGIQYGF
jgi:hypothetical protein